MEENGRVNALFDNIDGTFHVHFQLGKGVNLEHVGSAQYTRSFVGSSMSLAEVIEFTIIQKPQGTFMWRNMTTGAGRI